MQICNERPAYNNGRRAFPTCGKTCARALEAAKKTKPFIKSSNHPYSSGGSTPSSSRLPPAARGVNPWQMSLQSSEPRGPPPVYNPSAQSLCAVRNSRITSFVFISSFVCACRFATRDRPITMAVGPSLPAEKLARGRWKLLKRRHLLQEAVSKAKNAL
jgi:hypothetical protein